MSDKRSDQSFFANASDDKVPEEEVNNAHTEDLSAEAVEQDTDGGSVEEKEEQEENSATKDPLEEAQAEIAALKDKHLRLYSEFENFRRRTAKEKLEMIKNAGSQVIGDLLPVLDDLDRAIANNDKVDDIEAVKEGFKLIDHKLRSTLASKGLEPMDAIGKKFDTDHHEALTKIPAQKKKQKGKVMDVVERGYTLNGNVLRYAKVVVGE